MDRQQQEQIRCALFFSGARVWEEWPPTQYKSSLNWVRLVNKNDANLTVIGGLTRVPRQIPRRGCSGQTPVRGKAAPGLFFKLPSAVNETENLAGK
jgi:hypothetical protein